MLFLNTMVLSELLFECLFEVVGGGGKFEFAVLTVPRVRIDSGVKLTLHGRKGSLDHQILSYTCCPTLRCVRDHRIQRRSEEKCRL